MLKRVTWSAILFAAVAAIVPLRAEIIEQVLVKVNGDIITQTEFEKRQFTALQERPDLAKLSPNSPQFAQAIAESAPALILGAVDELLWLQRAKEHGWGLTDERYAEIVGNIRKENKLEDDATFKRALASEGLTEADLRRNIERQALISQVQQQDVMSKISVTEEEIRAFYDANKQEFTTPAELTLRELLIPVPTSDRGVNVAEDEAAHAKADDVRKRLVAGEPFPQLAAEMSSAASKSNGGLISQPLKFDELAPAIRTLLEPLKVGDITEVIPTKLGYQILKLESRSATKILPLEEARPAVSRKVAQQKSQSEMVKYLEKLRTQARITWRHQELKKAYEKALAQRRESAGLPAPPPEKS
jgi:parvulin-like peptidyl-prolyl isomerase